jgi:glutamyl/glutaminyl-tRNA synthetase
MRRGEFPEGSRVLRARIDMASPNINLREPTIYRIRFASHHRTGDQWCIYPMYDFTHCLSDSLEGITHSICTLEFENNRPLYDWFLDQLPVPCHPQQIEFARLNLSYTVLSKRKLLELVAGGQVRGWDDPRMPTLSGLRRRGYSPEAIRAFCDRIGVSKVNSVVDIALLEYFLREHLNKTARRDVEDGDCPVGRNVLCQPADANPGRPVPPEPSVDHRQLDQCVLEFLARGPGVVHELGEAGLSFVHHIPVKRATSIERPGPKPMAQTFSPLSMVVLSSISFMTNIMDADDMFP